MKHSEKLFLVVALAVLGASSYFYSTSMPNLEKQKAQNNAALNQEVEGATWKNIPVPELNITSKEWPELRAQDEEGKWFFQVFTPPQIWIDKNGKFVTESPYYKEQARQKFAYVFDSVSNEPYHIEYRGFYGATKDPFVQLVNKKSGKTLTGRLNVEIVEPATLTTKAVNTGITIKSFDVKRVKKPNGMIDQQVSISLYDKALGRDVEIFSYKPTVLQDQRRMTLKASDGSLWHFKSVGEKIEKGEAEYVVEKIDLDNQFALVKMIPQKDKGEVRVMKVSASGVEEK